MVNILENVVLIWQKKNKLDENIVVCRITNLLSKNVDSLIECEKAELADLQHKLDNLYKHKAEGAFIRSHRKWFEEGEQNPVYFFRLEREQAKINQIKKCMVDGNITDDPRNIAKFCAKFYSDLYTSKLSPKHKNDLFQTCKMCSVGGPPGTWLGTTAI